MTVGVIITAYNLERFIEEAIQSVLAQSMKPDQIIVVNDGSTDSSLNRILKYNNSVTVINHENNQGVLPSVIEAIGQLDTDIISFLDGDDRWRNDKLEQIAKVFATKPDTMLVTHSHQWMDGAGKVLANRDVTHKNMQRIIDQSAGNDVILDDLLKKSILSYSGVWLGSAFSIRRDTFQFSAFKQWSESFWGHNLSHQDQPIAAFLIAKNPDKRIHYIDQPLFQYRVFEGNTSGDSATLRKALHTLDRSKATVVRTYDLVRSIRGFESEAKVQKRKLMEIEYWQALYNRKVKTSISLMASLMTFHWKGLTRVKEAVRFFGVMVLGPESFLRHK